ncbi:phosphatase PAP2 family protein [Niallia sp. NCCP-28]|uniref:phosphatase PAP2 family protein n=1 Tax=Niallia sp. NCCP-28 TaxID=2934712 RepID=UPI002088E145|nr:phosphatase PAP2 family protein [Niallia sp. NCCP-28]GKU80844.1 phosphatidylglycerophosphatase B [Niallia sp. NCCP-28]
MDTYRMEKESQMTRKYVFFVLFIVLAGLAAFIGIAKWVTSKDVIAFDSTVIAFIQSFVSDRFTLLMIAISFFGSIKWIAVALIIIACLLCWKKKYALALFLLSASGGGALLNISLKWFFKRERPDILPIVIEKSYSFPSGHSMGSLLFYGSLAFVVLHLMKPSKIRKVAVVVFCLFILLIGISRIYLGVHFPTDVLGGYSVGMAFLFICIIVFRYYEKKTNR